MDYKKRDKQQQQQQGKRHHHNMIMMGRKMPVDYGTKMNSDSLSWSTAFMRHTWTTSMGTSDTETLKINWGNQGHMVLFVIPVWKNIHSMEY
jgi:hypothetical protein